MLCLFITPGNHSGASAIALPYCTVSLAGDLVPVPGVRGSSTAERSARDLPYTVRHAGKRHWRSDSEVTCLLHFFYSPALQQTIIKSALANVSELFQLYAVMHFYLFIL